MCEFSGKLIAWLDRELADDDAAAVERHLESCAACRDRLSNYEDVSAAVLEYFEALPVGAQLKPSPARRPLLRWLAPLAVAAAAAILIIVLPRHSVDTTPVTVSKEVQPLPGAPSPTIPAVAPVARRLQVAKRAPARLKPWTVPEQTVLIAIPADAIFPPGVFPEGVSFRAELSLAADGSPDRLFLRP
jgi:anti-sigma factor RsiW